MFGAWYTRAVMNGGAGVAAPVLYHILVMGQSNAEASASAPPLSTSGANSRQLMFNGGTRPGGASLTSLVALAESTGETVASGMTNYLTANTSHAYLVSNVGVGGADYNSIKKGTTPYNDALAQVTAAKALAASGGYSGYEVLSVVLIHGEQNQLLNTTTYAANVATLQSDFNTDAKAISLQTGDIPLFACQQNAYAPSQADTQPANGTYGSSTAYQLEQAHNGTSVFVVGPNYIYDYLSDYIHRTNHGQRWSGERFAKAIHNAIHGPGWTPLRPSSVAIDGAVITVTFAVPVAPLVFDYSLVVNPGTGKGFEYFDDSGAAPTITGVALNGTDKVDITLSGAPSGYTYRQIRYGHTPTTSGRAGRWAGSRGCLRDSDASMTSAYGYPLYNHALQFVRTF